jgi:hypothetical protein
MLAGAESKSASDNGQMIIIIGLFIQLIFFGMFIIVTVVFHRRIHNIPTVASLKTRAPWKRLLIVLYVSSGLIMIRSIFRVIEYIMGKDGELMAKEAYLYIFDGTLMLLVSLLFNWFHPSATINNENMHRFNNVDLETQLDALN